METRWARLARGGIAAVVSLFVAACSHAIAGGSLPNTAGLALCLAFAVLACVALAGRRLSVPRLAASVLVSQFLFHGMFTLLGEAAPAAQVPAMGGHMRSFEPVMVQSTGHVMSGWMWIAHAIAAVVTIVALRFGERAFWAIAGLVAPSVRRMPRLTIPARPSPQGVAPTREELPRRLAAILSALGHRGPPLRPA